MHHLRPLPLLAALLLAAPAGAQPMPQPGMAMPASPADSAMAAGMKTMQHDMTTAPMTGDPDHDFVSMMIPHHQGAIAMAQVELKFGHDPAMRKLAASIIEAQHSEIAEMRHWQATHPGG